MKLRVKLRKNESQSQVKVTIIYQISKKVSTAACGWNRR